MRVVTAIRHLAILGKTCWHYKEIARWALCSVIGGADLRAPHHHHALRRMHRRQRVHDLAQVGRPAGAPAPGLVGAARLQQAMVVGPRRNRKLRIGVRLSAGGIGRSASWANRRPARRSAVMPPGWRSAPAAGMRRRARMLRCIRLDQI